MIRFTFDDFFGEISAPFAPQDPASPSLEDRLRRLADPAAAVETVHWGRNYLWRTRWRDGNGASLEVVVKQWNNRGLRARLDRRLRGSRAERAWRIAGALMAAGIPTAEPVARIESKRADGPSFFVTRRLPPHLELRYLLRAINAGREGEEFPELDAGAVLDRVGHWLRRMHDAGIFHRDFSIGNVLIDLDDPERLWVVDLSRGRLRRRVSLHERLRDQCRLALFRPDSRRRFLDAYWDGRATPLRSGLYRLYHEAFHLKIRSRKLLRKPGRWLRQWLLPRRAHAHIPEAPAAASARDRIVWDALSDQPHQHATRLEKLAVRLADLPSHAHKAALAASSLPSIYRSYRRLRRQLHARPVAWQGAGVAVRPDPEAPDELLDALAELGLRHVLLRLHPWQEDDRAELELARELHARGYELAFSLPQNRALVRDPERWRRRIDELAETFSPYGRHFQVGQAINRSKWGVWTLAEYVRLAQSAAQILRRQPGVEVLGPAVIDFELHDTAAAVRACAGFGFDALASLLYVDRRGAPENTQLGFDTVGKVLLLQAIAEAVPGTAPRSWITEVNWPLREGPHSPAGRSVAVDEATQADYLARFYLLALTTGAVERVYWWQLVARGYGLVAPRDAAQPARRRPSFHALATLERQLAGRRCAGPLAAAGHGSAVRLYLFCDDDGGETVAGWSLGGPASAVLPRRAVAVVEQDGSTSGASGPEVELGGSVRYFHLE